MPRIASFAVLLAILAAIAVLFYMVMANFLLPLFLAVLLVVVFQPLHNWCIAKCGGRGRVAAGLTTAAIVLIVLVPLLTVLLQAGAEGVAIYDRMQSAAVPQKQADAAAKPRGKDGGLADAMIDVSAVANEAVLLGHRVGVHLDAADVETGIRQGIQDWFGPAALTSVRFTGNFLIGLGVMIVALYYFLADGPWMVRKVMQLSPLEDRYEEQLIEQFGQISRAVVLATLLSALVQGLLAGIGFYFAGVNAVFLLMVMAAMFAMVPFVGATIVWAPTCLWLYFVDGRPVAAVGLAIYCMAIVATADNVIKPLVLHGRSNLHPLLALLSVIGGVQALGPIGIFVGPMVVVFLHALLNMLHGELEALGKKPAEALAEAAPPSKKLSPASRKR